MYSYKSYILLESKREEELKAKYIDKLGVDEDIFQKFYDNKNTEWLLKQFIKKDLKNPAVGNTNEREKYANFLLTLVKKFDDKKQNLNIKELSKIESVDDLVKILNEDAGFDDAEERYGDDIWVLLNSPEWFIFKPYTWESSEELGGYNNDYKSSDIGAANWCTTYSDKHFNEKLGPQGGLLYCVNKLDYTKDWAIQFETDGTIIAWDYTDSDIYTEDNLHDICWEIWGDKENESYKVIMSNEQRLDENRPDEASIDWDKAKENARTEIRNMGISEFVDFYGDAYVWNNFNDESFLSDTASDEQERFYDEWKYEDDLVKIVLKMLNNDFEQWTPENKQWLFKTFKPDMEQANTENEREDYPTEPMEIENVISYIEDSFGKGDGVDLVEKCSLEDEVIEYLAKRTVNNYGSGKNYFESMYGNLSDVGRNGYGWLNDYINWSDIATEVVDDMDEEELKNYI